MVEQLLQQWIDAESGFGGGAAIDLATWFSIPPLSWIASCQKLALRRTVCHRICKLTVACYPLSYLSGKFGESAGYRTHHCHNDDEF